jgi:hypothetical protein
VPGRGFGHGRAVTESLPPQDPRDALIREQAALFATVEAFEALPVPEAFATLGGDVPALSTLEQQIHSWLADPAWQNRTSIDRWRDISREVSQLVGPSSPGESLLTRSHAALETARFHLAAVAGLHDDEAET